MKCFSKIILLGLALNLIIIISSLELNLSRNNKRRLNSLKRHNNRHHRRDDPAQPAQPAQSAQTEQSSESEGDCGCKIVYAYYEGPKIQKKKPYKRRWPEPADIPKPPEQVKEPVVCTPEDGDVFLEEMSALFPPPIAKRKPKKKEIPKPEAPKVVTGPNGSTTTTVVITKSSTVVSSPPPPPPQKPAEPPKGKFTTELLALAEKFKEKVIADQKNGLNNKSKKSKEGKKKKLTADEKEKLNLLRTKNIFLKKARKECYHKIRKYLQPEYKITYKDTKCHIIGRLFFTCFPL